MSIAHEPFHAVDWSLSPTAQGPDIHLESAGRSLAHMGTIGAATLKEIFKEQLRVLGNPEASAQAKADAERMLMGGLEINEVIAGAQENLAQGRELQAQLHSQPRESFAPNGRADEIARQMAEHFSQARQNMVEAGAELSRQPALSTVLARAGETLSGFAAGVARGAVALQGLASRALALPGMVRDRLVDKTMDAGTAIQGALTDFHTATAQRMNHLRDEAAEVASRAWGATQEAAAKVRAGVESKVNEAKAVGAEVAQGARLMAKDMVDETRGAAVETMDTIREGVGHATGAVRQKVDSVKQGSQEVYEGVRDTVVFGASVLQAVDQTVEAKVVEPVKNWFAQKGLPAIKSFAKEFSQDFKTRLDEGMSSSMAERRAARGARVSHADTAAPQVKSPSMS